MSDERDLGPFGKSLAAGESGAKYLAQYFEKRESPKSKTSPDQPSFFKGASSAPLTFEKIRLNGSGSHSDNRVERSASLGSSSDGTRTITPSRTLGFSPPPKPENNTTPYSK